MTKMADESEQTSKRLKGDLTDIQTSSKRKLPSTIFTPFRTIGLVSPTDVPFTSIPLGKTTFQLTTSVGRSLQTYDLRKGLNLIFLTRPETPAPITATVAWKDRVLAAWGGSQVSSSHATSASGIWVYKRGLKIAELDLPSNSSRKAEKITRIFVFGAYIIGGGPTKVEVWKSDTYEHYTTIIPSAPLSTNGHVSESISNNHTSQDVLSDQVCSMPTYLNKIFVGKTDGCVEVWNVKSAKLIYTIYPSSTVSGSVTALEPSPAISILAIARSDNSIVLHNIEKDKILLKVTAGVAVQSISFRTDGLGAGEDGDEDGMMATSSRSSADITFWDLNNGGRVKGVLRGAHELLPSMSTSIREVSGINKIEFLPGQSVIVSSGQDNALRTWIFDDKALSSIPRILHSRSGHAAPATRLQFVPVSSDDADDLGKWLLSSGRDHALWAWSLRRDGQSTELSQGRVRHKAKKLGLLGKVASAEASMSLEDLKAPEITSMACSLNRDGGMGGGDSSGGVWTNVKSTRREKDESEVKSISWESIITAHRGDKFARTWFWGRKKAGRWAFESADSTEVTNVAITFCGSFAFVGSAGGSIVAFNLQSGIERQRYPAPLNASQIKNMKATQRSGDLSSASSTLASVKHTRSVTGIAITPINRTVISCGLDGRIKFWEFSSGKLRGEINWSTTGSILGLRYFPANDLIALSCDDQCIRIIDIETKKTVRELWGSMAHIIDFCFSNDGRWVIAASMDSVIRVWDLPTGHLINALATETPCTAMTFSETGEFLATAHANSLGINLWNNRTIFRRVPTRAIREDEIIHLQGPTASGQGGKNSMAAAFEADTDESETDDLDVSIPVSEDKLNQDLIKLSLVPKAQWQTLLHLDTIRQRNKPKDPPKKPEKAPFFLPSSLSDKPDGTKLTELTNGSSSDMQVTASDTSRIYHMSRTMGKFSLALSNADADQQYEPFISYLSALPPSAADVELRTMTIEEMPAFIRSLTFQLGQRSDFELVQTWMSVFLRLHADVVPGDEDLKSELKKWQALHEREKQRLTNLVDYNLGVMTFLKSGR